MEEMGGVNPFPSKLVATSMGNKKRPVKGLLLK
jgi:hypothetical protein